MKKLSIVSLFLILFFLPSCLPSAQLSERAIVEAIGIDKTDDRFTVSIAYYNPDSNNPENSQTSFVKHTAKSISSAISGINSKISKKLYFGHNNIVVIGENAAKNDIRSILKYFESDPHTKSDICVFVAENAEEIIAYKDENSEINPQTMLKITENSLKLGEGCEYKLYKAISMDRGYDSAFVLPFGKISEEKIFEIVGGCLFKDANFADLLSKEETRGLQWYNGNIEDTIIGLENYDIKVKSCETTVKTLVIKDTPVFKITISAEIERPIKEIDTIEEENILSSANTLIEKEVIKVINRAFTKENCDIFGFYERLSNKFPKFLETNTNGYEKNTADIEVIANCRFD